MNLQEKSRCTECGWIGETDEVLEAPNPFDAFSQEIIQGCPKCKQVECMECVCDEPGCKLPVNGGTPTPEGYRQTCYKHNPMRTEDKMEC